MNWILLDFVFLIRGLLFLCAVTCALHDSKNTLQQSLRLPQGTYREMSFIICLLFSNCVLVVYLAPSFYWCWMQGPFPVYLSRHTFSGSEARFEEVGAFELNFSLSFSVFLKFNMMWDFFFLLPLNFLITSMPLVHILSQKTMGLSVVSPTLSSLCGVVLYSEPHTSPVTQTIRYRTCL